MNGTNTSFDDILAKAESIKTVDSVSNEPEDQPQQIDYEAAYKELQAEYTKSRQEVAALKTKAVALEKEIENKGIEIDPEVADELEALKYSDPEAWRTKLNAIEKQRAKEIESKVSQEIEAERRAQLLAEYNKNNPDFQLNDYVAQNVLPASFMKRLEANEISFDTFLAEASDYLKRVQIGPGNSPKAGRKAPILQVDGGASPDTNRVNYDVSYAEAVF